MLKLIMDAMAVIIFVLVVAIIFRAFFPNVAAQDYITCRNNAGEVIHVAPPHLCPPGYWQI